MTTEREKFEDDARPYGYDFSPANCACCDYANGTTQERYYGWQACAEQKQAEIDALRKEFDITKARILKVEEANSILSEELEATEGALKLSAAKYKSDAGIQQFVSVKEKEMIDALRAELEQMKMHNVMLFDAVVETKSLHSASIIERRHWQEYNNEINNLNDVLSATSEQVEAYRAEIIAKAKEDVCVALNTSYDIAIERLVLAVNKYIPDFTRDKFEKEWAEKRRELRAIRNNKE